MTAQEERLSIMQYKRGFSDGKVGHSPSLLRGSYMEGYIAGASGGGHSASAQWARGVKQAQEEWAEKKRLKDRIKELEDPETCVGCGNPATFAKWICQECTS